MEDLDSRKLAIFCPECDSHIGSVMLSDHSLLHKSLKVLHRDMDYFPTSPSELASIRLELIQPLRGLSTEKEKSKFSNINKAYNFLNSLFYERSIVESSKLREEMNLINSKVYRRESPCCKEISSCISKNGRYKTKIEDRLTLKEWRGGDLELTYIGLFDGYNGDFTANVSSQALHHLLLLEMEKFTACHFTKNFERVANDRRKLLLPIFKTDNTNCVTDEIHGFTDAIRKHCGVEIGKFDDSLKSAESNQSFTDYLRGDKELSRNSVIYDNQPAASENSLRESNDNIESLFKDRAANDKVGFSSEMSQAFQRVYKLMDVLVGYGGGESSKVRWSGASVSTVVIENLSAPSCNYSNEKDDDPLYTGTCGLLHLANAGNIQGLLIKNCEGTMITADHSCNNRRERRRVISQGGKVLVSGGRSLLNGTLATTRGLGNHGDQKLKRIVSPKPHTVTVPIDESCRVLVLATHGLWHVLSEQDVTSIALQVMSGEESASDKQVFHDVRDLISSKIHPSPSTPSSRPNDVAGVAELTSNTHGRTITSNSNTENRSAKDQNKIIPGTRLTKNDISDLVHEQVSSDLSWLEKKPESRTIETVSEKMARHLVEVALLAGSTDNISVVIVLFH